MWLSRRTELYPRKHAVNREWQIRDVNLCNVVIDLLQSMNSGNLFLIDDWQPQFDCQIYIDATFSGTSVDQRRELARW